MKVTPEQLASTQPEGLREVLRKMPATIADAIGGLSEVAGHYIAAAYFTDTGAMDEPDSSADMAPAAVLKALADCAAFMHRVGSETLIAYGAAGGDLARFGHDFWLTRNGHGAGFWDRDNLDVPALWTGKDQTLGEHLTDLAQVSGQCDLVQGDDGLLYFEGGA